MKPPLGAKSSELGGFSALTQEFGTKIPANAV